MSTAAQLTANRANGIGDRGAKLYMTPEERTARAKKASAAAFAARKAAKR